MRWSLDIEIGLSRSIFQCNSAFISLIRKCRNTSRPKAHAKHLTSAYRVKTERQVRAKRRRSSRGHGVRAEQVVLVDDAVRPLKGGGGVLGAAGGVPRVLQSVVRRQVRQGAVAEGRLRRPLAQVPRLPRGNPIPCHASPASASTPLAL